MTSIEETRRFLTEEHKAKLRKAWEKRRLTPFSVETRTKMRLAMKDKRNQGGCFKKGNKGYWLGKKRSEETIKKISLFRLGKKCSEETRAKMRQAHMGHIVKPETRIKIGRGNSVALKGKHPSEETRMKIGLAQKGEKSHFWKGGLSGLREYKNRKRKEYRHNRGISKNYRCQNTLGLTRKEMKRHYRKKYKYALKNAGDLSIKTIQLVYEDNIKKYGTLTCIYCNNLLEFGQDTLEHIIPLARGGTNEYNNLGIACKHCNSSKGKKLITEWRYLNPWPQSLK